jgi:predicted PurR-regulated permease PerM
MKTLTAVVVIILLAITAGGVTGYFLYTDLVKDTTKIIIQQQAQIDQQTTDIQTLQKEIDVQDTKLQRDNKDINAIIDVLNKAFQPTPKDGGDSPSSFDKSMTDDMLGAGEYLHTTSGN